MSRLRKLITRDTLYALSQDLDRGVPLARAIANQKLEMSRPAVAKLVGVYNSCFNSATYIMPSQRQAIRLSLNPIWLTKDGQEQPADWKYEGYFPLGVWKQL